MSSMTEDNEEPRIKRLVLDVLKPHSPTLLEFASELGSLKDVEEVDVDLREIDKDTHTLKVTVYGNLHYSDIKSKIEDWGGVVHSVDRVVVGSRVQGLRNCY